MKRWLDNPRSTLARRVLFYVHLVSGLAIGLALTVVALSGSALVFRPEIEESLYQPTVHVGTARASLDAMVTMIIAQHPERRLSRMQLPRRDDQSLEVVLSRRGARTLNEAQQLSVFADPYSGRVLKEHAKQQSFLFFLQDLHFSLLAGVPGLTINGVMSMLLVVMCVTGLVIWWPGRPRWRSGFHIQWNASWKRATWDAHSVVGFFSAAFLLVFAITGTYYGFRAKFTETVLSMTGSAPPPRAPVAQPGPSVSLDSVVQSARSAMPGARILAIRFPAVKSAPYVASASVRNHSGEGEDRIYVDARGTVLRVDRLRDLAGGARLLETMNPLHLGTFGGTFTRGIWVLLGLVPPLLFVTGLIVWWNRVIVPRLRALRVERASPSAVSTHA